MKINRLFKLSRPKFWLYTSGPFLLGSIPVMQANPSTWPMCLFGFIWFLLLGNLFVYGINDLADEDTDALNEKKDDKDEIRVMKKEKKILAQIIWTSALSGGIFFLFSHTAGLYWMAFLFFSWAYSALPIRAKAHPFLDGIFNILYVLPAGVALSIGSLPFSWFYLVAGTLWCMAMHAISAIPDIIPDTQVHLRTTAVVLGRNRTLAYVTGCYILALVLLSFVQHTLPIKVAMFLLALYAMATTFFFINKKIDIKNIYPYYPIANTISGMLLFFALLFR